MNEGFGPIGNVALGDFDPMVLPPGATEMNTALPVTAKKTVQVGLAAERDTPLPLSLAGKLLMEQTGPLADLADDSGAEELVAKIDLASVRAAKSVPVGLAEETDTAGPVGAAKSVTVQLQGVSTAALAGQLGVTVEAVSTARSGQLRIEQHHVELWLLATSLGQLARTEIARLENELPNSPSGMEANRSQRELLLTLANGFAQLADALADFAANKDKPLLLGKAGELIESLRNEVQAWWAKNKADAVDWCIAIPAIGIASSTLEIFGTPQPYAAAIAAAYIGRDKVKDIWQGMRDPG